MKVWISYGATADDANEPATEIVGVFLDGDEALAAALVPFPSTGAADEYEVGEIAPWARS